MGLSSTLWPESVTRPQVHRRRVINALGRSREQGGAYPERVRRMERVVTQMRSERWAGRTGSRRLRMARKGRSTGEGGGLGSRLRSRVGIRRGSSVAFTKADAARLNEAFSRLDRGQRRSILRAVNRGQALPDKRSAELAVGIARRQQRFWRRAWLLGPIIAVIQASFTPIGVQETLLLAAWGTLLLGMMAFWWWSRARRAEELNVAYLVQRGGRPSFGGSASALGGTSPSRPGPDRRRSRLPGGPALPISGGAHADDAVGATDSSSRAANAPDGAPDARPPRPRGQKRR